MDLNDMKEFEERVASTLVDNMAVRDAETQQAVHK